MSDTDIERSIMNLSNKTIGFALTGSFCTYSEIIPIMKDFVDLGAKIIPIMSYNSNNIDSRFGTSDDFINQIKEITGNKPIVSIEDVEPLGPKNLIDILVIAPCTGNSIAKIANGITDTPVLMAAKGHLRNNKPLVLFLSSNDSLGLNLKNIGILLNSKNIYFVPFGQDNYIKKPNSLVSHTDLIIDTVKEAIEGKQIQPVIKQY